MECACEVCLPTILVSLSEVPLVRVRFDEADDPGKRASSNPRIYSKTWSLKPPASSKSGSSLRSEVTKSLEL